MGKLLSLDRQLTVIMILERLAMVAATRLAGSAPTDTLVSARRHWLVILVAVLPPALNPMVFPA